MDENGRRYVSRGRGRRREMDGGGGRGGAGRGDGCDVGGVGAEGTGGGRWSERAQSVDVRGRAGALRAIGGVAAGYGSQVGGALGRGGETAGTDLPGQRRPQRGDRGDCPGLPSACACLRTPAPLVRADEPGARPSSSSAPENFRPSPGPRRHRHRRAPTGRRSRCSPPTALPRPHRDRDRDHLPTARPLISTALALPPPSGLLLAPFLRSQPRFARAPLPASDPSRLESPLPDHPRRHPRLLPSSTHISSTAQPSPRARTPSPPSHSLAAG